MTYTRERLGELLVKAGLLDEEQLQAALLRQKTEGGKIGEVLVRGDLALTEDQIAEALANQKGLERVDVMVFPVDRAAVTLLPERLCRLRTMLPIGFRDGSVLLAMADPLDIESIDDVHLRTGMAVVPLVATPTAIRHAIEKYITSPDAIGAMAEKAPTTEEEDAEAQAEATRDDVPVVRLVNQLIREAVIDGASDVHIEPAEHSVRVRYRVDGVLHEHTTLPKAAQAGILSRVKIMADMDIAERRRPQDGRIGISVEGRNVDLRVAALPTPWGEGIVIRILNQGLTFRSLPDLGMAPDHLAIVERLISRPYGAVLISGPTGSGKSTTMYAALQMLNTSQRKIITIEDPIEYQMVGITQMATNAKIGVTFASGLRTMLRADPDVVMVGEIRDAETAEIAVRAALTGHLLMSSIHTNDAPSALTRLVDMKVAPYVTSSALLGVIAQRLVRMLCSECKVRQDVPREVLIAAGFDAERAERLRPFSAVGCPSCHGTGYRGRVGLFEIMELDDELVRLFLQEAPSEQLRKVALEHGMRSLREDGLDKVEAGLTSLDELGRVVV